MHAGLSRTHSTIRSSRSQDSKVQRKLILFEKAQITANTNLIPNQVGEANIKEYMNNEKIERNKLIFMLLVHKHIFHNILQNEELNHLFKYIIDRAWPKLNHLIQNLHIITDENSKHDIIWGEVIQLLTEDFTNLTEKEKEIIQI